MGGGVAEAKVWPLLRYAIKAIEILENFGGPNKNLEGLKPPVEPRLRPV